MGALYVHRMLEDLSVTAAYVSNPPGVFSFALRLFHRTYRGVSPATALIAAWYYLFMVCTRSIWHTEYVVLRTDTSEDAVNSPNRVQAWPLLFI